MAYLVFMPAHSLAIETARLCLRALEERDVPDLVSYLSEDDPMVHRVLNLTPRPEVLREYWGKMRDRSPFDNPKEYSMRIEFKADRKVVGNVGFSVIRIDDQHKHGSIGWSLSARYRDRGIATEAAHALLDFLFCKLNLHRVSARTGEDNIRSRKLMEQLGMRREGHFRQSHTNLGNRWVDEYVCAVLERDWTTVRNASR